VDRVKLKLGNSQVLVFSVSCCRRRPLKKTSSEFALLASQRPSCGMSKPKLAIHSTTVNG